MTEKFVLEHTGYIEEVRKKLYWEVQVDDDEVRVVQRGGPLEPIVLTVKINQGPSFDSCMEVDDWWGWGAG